MYKPEPGGFCTKTNKRCWDTIDCVPGKRSACLEIKGAFQCVAIPEAVGFECAKNEDCNYFNHRVCEVSDNGQPYCDFAAGPGLDECNENEICKGGHLKCTQLYGSGLPVAEDPADHRIGESQRENPTCEYGFSNEVVNCDLNELNPCGNMLCGSDGRCRFDIAAKGVVDSCSSSMKCGHRVCDGAKCGRAAGTGEAH